MLALLGKIACTLRAAINIPPTTSTERFCRVTKGETGAMAEAIQLGSAVALHRVTKVDLYSAIGSINGALESDAAWQ